MLSKLAALELEVTCFCTELGQWWASVPYTDPADFSALAGRATPGVREELSLQDLFHPWPPD